MSKNDTVVPFSFESYEIRTIQTDEGETLWVAKDIAEALGYKDVINAIKQHCKGAVKHRPLATTGGIQQVRVIHEPDLYRLIVGSKLPSAIQFETWIFDEVLPAIRRTGSYCLSTKRQSLLEGEIVTGASLLAQVVNKEGLPEEERWELIDTLFLELFGSGVELLYNKEWGTQHPTVERQGIFDRAQTPAPILELALARGLTRGYEVRLSPQAFKWFTMKFCNTGKKEGCTQAGLYHHFSSWYEGTFHIPAPPFSVLHDTAARHHKSLVIGGEAWFVGISPKRETLLLAIDQEGGDHA